MIRPEDAAGAARRAAAERRAAGDYAEAHPFGVPGTDHEVAELRLYQWALIEPDLRQVRSTRRLGAPITWLKRALLRLLAQYHVQLIAEQTRFNVSLLGYVRRLEARIEELEAGKASPAYGDRAGGRSPGHPRDDEPS